MVYELLNALQLSKYSNLVFYIKYFMFDLYLGICIYVIARNCFLSVVLCFKITKNKWDICSANIPLACILRGIPMKLSLGKCKCERQSIKKAVQCLCLCFRLLSLSLSLSPCLCCPCCQFVSLHFLAAFWAPDCLRTVY